MPESTQSVIEVERHNLHAVSLNNLLRMKIDFLGLEPAGGWTPLCQGRENRASPGLQFNMHSSTAVTHLPTKLLLICSTL